MGGKELFGVRENVVVDLSDRGEGGTPPRRVGDTIRCRPAVRPDYARRLLQFLAEAGFDAAPRFLGVDEAGCDILSYAEGVTPEGLNWGRWTDDQFVTGFRLLRQLHDLTAGTAFAEDAEVACHNDFAPPNLVFRADLPAVLIDWEWAAPGTRRHDLAHAIWQWTNFRDGAVDFDEQVRRVRLLLNAYGTGPYPGMVDDIVARQNEWLDLAEQGAHGTVAFLGRSPAYWAAVQDWVAAEREWWALNGPPIEAAIVA